MLTPEVQVARERARSLEVVAEWMLAHGFTTGHGDTIEALLGEMLWQINEKTK